MIEVTDPSLISKLESMEEVTDPDLISKLESGESSSIASNQDNKQSGNFISKVLDAANALTSTMSNPLTSFTKPGSEKTAYGQLGRGFVSGASELPRQAANLLPGVNLPELNLGQGGWYKAGQLGGEAADYLALSEALPGLGASKLANAIGRIGGSSAYGAVMNPENRTAGAIEGGLAGGVGESIPLLAKGADFFRPTKFARNIAKTFSPESIENISDRGMNLYENAFSGIKESPIYSNESKMEYLTLPEDQIKKNYDIDLKKLHERFLKNPTLQNAHELQSQLGSEMRDLYKMKSRLGTLPQADKNTLISYKYAHKLLNKDIDSFLKDVDKNALPHVSGDSGRLESYKNATENWAKNVVPARNASLVISKLGRNYTPEKMLKSLERAEDLGTQLPDTLSRQLESLKSMITARNVLQGGIGATIGGSAAPMVGPGTETLGLLGGAALGPKIINTLVSNFKINPKASEFMDKLLKNLYKPVSKSVIANVLGGEKK